MSKTANFLVEIGTEELPPKALRSLMEAFGKNLADGIDTALLSHGEIKTFASPRRLTVFIADLAEKQNDQKSEQKGPPISIAFDKAGKPTAAAKAFARKCGTTLDALGRNKTNKGEWLTSESLIKGKKLIDLLPSLIEKSLSALPIPRRMRWGASEVEFVRPLHWIVMLHGNQTIETSIMGIETGNQTWGHRFHSSGPITINSSDTYLDTLEHDGYVIADFDRRLKIIRDGVNKAATVAGGVVVSDDALYDEVAALVEWPVPIIGSFDKAFLELPREAIISTLTAHQRYFPIEDQTGNLLANFITIANLASKNPEQVRDGNERVIRPRLSDATFFWTNDKQSTLSSREAGLHKIVYQQGLGSLFDKSQRVAVIAKSLAKTLKHDNTNVSRAALLAKCDLLTGMVGEFPTLQGIMGYYYAIVDGETEGVATAIREHYLPRFAGDNLPETIDGQLLAIADKLDTLAGIFSTDKKPSGNRDPFGLRRAALGVVRLLIECGIDIDLKELIQVAVNVQPEGQLNNEKLTKELYVFVTDRLRRYFLDRDTSLTSETFEAVIAQQPTSLIDFDRRLVAVQTFARLEQAESLASANKRIANILRKADFPEGLVINKKLLSSDVELALFNFLENAQNKIAPMLAVKNYAEVLNELADLRDPIDQFFNEVMVMDEDQAVRNNRLALLSDLRALFLHVADISRRSLG